MRTVLIVCLLAALTSPVFAQDNAQALPKVFILGEEEKLYETLTKTYSETLLSACDGNMELAVEKWLGMMQEMEAYAKKIRYELRGIKLWMHVFWDTDGAIKHIGFRLRPDSRNVRQEELAAFLVSFMGKYKLPLTHSTKYAHYVGVTFPTFVERLEK